MKTLIKFSTTWLAMAVPVTAMAQFTANTNYTVGLSIPDNNASGLAVTESFSSSEIFQITDLEVSLSISGGFNGDYYAYLTHDSGFSVLLNRVGRDGGNLFGYPDAGMDVVLDDGAVNGDIHVYRTVLNPNGAALTGIWAPDARTEDPASVLTSSPRSAFLSSFNGLDPNGDWTLFIADLDAGNTGILESWGLNVMGVPEPSSAALLLLAGSLFLRGRRARRSRSA